MVKPDAALFSHKELSEPPEAEATVVLSLDISKTCLGWALGIGEEVVNYGKVVFKTTTPIGNRVIAFAEFIDSVLDAYHPDVLVIEEPLHRASVISHFEFLGILRYKWYHYCGEHIPEENLISPKTVKTHMHVKRGKTHKENKKIMVDKVNSLLGISLDFHKNSSYKSDDDVADAIAVLLTYLRIKP